MKEFVRSPGGIIVMISLCIVLITVGIIYAHTSHQGQASKQSIVTTVAVAATEPVDTITESQALDTLLFSYLIVDACHDKKNNIYFMHIPKHPDSDGYLATGWYMTNGFEYKILENNTVVITKEQRWDRIVVDTDGLTCKSQVAGPDWFK